MAVMSPSMNTCTMIFYMHKTWIFFSKTSVSIICTQLSMPCFIVGKGRKSLKLSPIERGGKQIIIWKMKGKNGGKNGSEQVCLLFARLIF